MTNISILLSFFVFSIAFAECVHEKTALGIELIQMESKHSIFIEQEDSRYVSSKELRINPSKKYNIQIFEKKNVKSNDPHTDYNKKFLTYYTYSHIQKYLELNKSKLKSAGYDVSIIGKSLEGRKLFSVTPKNLLNKKTIVMFGRHHGDEGTANWIIEGFLDEFLNNKNFQNDYQLLLYPMINPDGVEAHSRYNSKGRDLNRSWHKSLDESFDEIKIIHSDLKKKMNKIGSEVFIALDMHGSFTKDFIYRVKRNYVNRRFYKLQQEFIDELGLFDSWQNGNDNKSNGDERMARIVLINHYKKNALTHETVKNITKTNSSGRTIHSLKDQGLSIIKSIKNLY